MATKYQYYTTGANGQFWVWGIYLQAQSFTPAIAHTITSVKLQLYRAGSPGTITVAIRATDGSGHPTGADLCTGTTNGNTLTTSSAGELREITLGAGTSLTIGTKYAIEVRVPSGGSGGAVAVGWRVNNGGSYSGGETLRYDGVSAWTGYGYDAMFEEWGDATPIVAPTVTIQDVTDIGKWTATGNGNITSIGDAAVTQHGVCWATTPNPTTSDSKTEEGAASGTGAFTANMTSLTPNTTYHIRAYATNTAGTSYSNDLEFTTGGLPTASSYKGTIWLEGDEHHAIDNNGVEQTWTPD